MALRSVEALRWPVEWSAKSAKRWPPPEGGAAAGRGNRRVQVSFFWIASGPGSAKSGIMEVTSLPSAAAARAVLRASCPIDRLS